MLGSQEDAGPVIEAVLEQHPGEPERWLAALVAPFLIKRTATRVDRFAELDDILRTNSTIPIDLSHPLVHGDARRLDALLAELRRTCLLTTLRGLAPQRRALFILRHVLGLSVEATAAVCETTVDAVTTAEGRGRRELENYLNVRCEHLDARNTCHCAARLGNALDRGLVRWPDRSLDARPRPETTYSAVTDLYASLPRVRLALVDG
jgi:hypothetical protein